MRTYKSVWYFKAHASGEYFPFEIFQRKIKIYLTNFLPVFQFFMQNVRKIEPLVENELN